MSAIDACRNRHSAVFFSISLNMARVKTSQRASHLLRKMHIFNNRGAMAYPTAQSAQNSSPVFLTSSAFVIGSKLRAAY
jgi:hypothetical protein